MAETNLGKTSFTPKGAYSSGTTYNRLDVVTNSGSSYCAKDTNSNVEPGVTTGWESHWMLFSSVGSQGQAGVAAGFGTPTATVSALAAGATPTVSIQASGEDIAKVFGFTFGIPKGDQGDAGTGNNWYVGTAITGTSTTETAYATGIESAAVGDMYLNNGELPDTGRAYRCTVAGNATTAKWVYSCLLRGADGSGVGDMLKSTYDSDNDGIVDDSEKLGGNAASYYQAATLADYEKPDTTSVITTSDTVGSAIGKLEKALDGKSASTHDHGNITNAGAIGSTSGLIVKTGTNGVLTTGTVGASNIAANAVTNAKIAKMAAYTIKGNNTNATADPQDIAASSVRTMIGAANATAFSSTGAPTGDNIGISQHFTNGVLDGLAIGGTVAAQGGNNVDIDAALGRVKLYD